MAILSFLMLLLLSLLGYSAGVAGRAGKDTDPKPQLLDLFLVVLIWGGAIASRFTLGLNRWLLILLWMAVSGGLGYLSFAFRRRISAPVPKAKETQEPALSGLRKIWENWKRFSRRMGGFQSRVLLSFFFFGIVSPFALAVKMFSDPLRLKYPSTASYWLRKNPTPGDLEDYKRQF